MNIRSNVAGLTNWSCSNTVILTMSLIILFFVALFLAYSNGANDNFKGVATLFGSGTANYRHALGWATVTTLMGSVVAIFLAGTLVKNFSGKGLVPDELIQTPEFAIAIALGAGFTVLLATRFGMPVSTTHSLVGALFGSGVVAVGSEFSYSRSGGTFLIPLLLSPLLAAIASLIIYQSITVLGRFFSRLSLNPLLISYSESALVVVENESSRRNQGGFVKINDLSLVNAMHYLSAGVVSFARGLNDTPKIVGLLLVINTLDIRRGMLAIAIAMAVGGLLNARKVGETVSKKITAMDSGQGLTANLVTGLLVTTASIHGLPVSTTHVSVGSIFGIGTVTRQADVSVIRNILLSWLLTLPVAAISSGLIYLLVSRI